MPTEKAEYEQKQKTTHEFQNVFAPKNPFLFPFSTNLLKSPLASLPIHRPRLFLVSDLRPTGAGVHVVGRGGLRENGVLPDSAGVQFRSLTSALCPSSYDP